MVKLPFEREKKVECSTSVRYSLSYPGYNVSNQGFPAESSVHYYYTETLALLHCT